ncbi:hypothetical protein A8L45_14605 [Veronia pacifica]|uniref:Uncharacterized protein n=1 Tax=Veronia pacifica TaxID=1080227 RepID=A0A1C3EF54_9GAMM|nr:hypothetical protein A8L45_14605 [Veronia pacifica]
MVFDLDDDELIYVSTQRLKDWHSSPQVNGIEIIMEYWLSLFFGDSMGIASLIMLFRMLAVL